MDKTTMGEGGGGGGLGGGGGRVGILLPGPPTSLRTQLFHFYHVERKDQVGLGGGGVQVNVFFFSFDVQWAFTVILSVCMLVA